MLGATLEDGRQLLAAVHTDLPGVSAAPPLDLVAQQQPPAAQHEGAAIERAGERIGLRLGALVEFKPFFRQGDKNAASGTA